jgi:hypothetical protein
MSRRIRVRSTSVAALMLSACVVVTNEPGSHKGGAQAATPRVVDRWDTIASRYEAARGSPLDGAGSGPPPQAIHSAAASPHVPRNARLACRLLMRWVLSLPCGCWLQPPRITASGIS